MEQRAERARWMKSDLETDAQMPMMLDYINSPLGADDAIKQAYSAGPYHASVIDCDGSIIFTSFWGWGGPGGQWWYLSLASAAELVAFLEDYLANPPPCYVPPAGIDPPVRTTGDLEGPATVLVVDDDGGADYEGYFTIPLGYLKINFDKWSVQESGSPPAETLGDYNAVVWFTGDTAEDTLMPSDQAGLAAYLDAGGRLLLSGQDIGQDIGSSPFYQDYLHASFITDDTSEDQLVGDDTKCSTEP